MKTYIVSITVCILMSSGLNIMCLNRYKVLMGPELEYVCNQKIARNSLSEAKSRPS